MSHDSLLYCLPCVPSVPAISDPKRRMTWNAAEALWRLPTGAGWVEDAVSGPGDAACECSWYWARGYAFRC